MRAPTLQRQFKRKISMRPNTPSSNIKIVVFKHKSLPYPNRTGDPLIPPCVFHDVTRVLFRSLLIYSQLLFQLS